MSGIDAASSGGAGCIDAVSFDAVSFDFGQTIARLDAGLLAERLRERGYEVSAERIRAALLPAWATYDRLVREKVSGHPWHALMTTLLEQAGVAEAGRAELVEFLWRAQPERNLWREPIEGMVPLLEQLVGRGVPLVVLSNSEGRLVQLIGEMGLSELLPRVIDSGVVGITKPDPRIFELAAQRIGVPNERILHVGDSLSADVRGALTAGFGALWFGQPELPEDLRPCPRAFAACGAFELQHVLQALGLL